MQLRQLGLRKNTLKGSSLIPYMLGICALGCLMVQVFVSNRFAAAGKSISATDMQINELSQENNLLREQIASSSAIITVKNQAEGIGFVHKISPLFLTLDLPVAAGLK